MAGQPLMTAMELQPELIETLYGSGVTFLKNNYACRKLISSPETQKE